MSGGVQAVGVVGAGVMGAEIALVAAIAGFHVTLVDVDAEAVGKGLAHAGRVADGHVARGRLEADVRDAALARIRIATSPAGLADADLVIEAVPERLALKQQVLAGIAAGVRADVLVASNTSGLSITALAASAPPVGRVVGLHFFNPASVMRLVEVIRGEGTTDQAAEGAAEFARALGKEPVSVRECPGFVVNRILVRAMAAAYRTSVGVDPAAADAAVVQAGPAPMGPHALGDLIGLDTLEAIRGDLMAAYGDRYDDGGVLAPMVAAGRLGRKTGGGFFVGPPGEVVPVPEGARQVGALYYAAARDEAQRIADEGVARVADINTAMRLGTGWSEDVLAATR